ncbi:MAG: Gp49 family protein [Alishewanella aestuarii]
MKKYIGIKQVFACPMTREAYNQLRGWTVPADENPADEGYLVEYIDGGKANHPYYAGYISWSPKDVFERAYKPVDPSDLEMQQAFETAGAVYPKVSAERIAELMANVQYSVHIVPGTTTTLATAFIQVGSISFTLATEHTACVDPHNFNAELGAKYAIQKAEVSARNKLWELEGYTLARRFAGE